MQASKRFGSISSLLLSGEAANNTLFNHTPQRGAPSVHLTYTVPDDAKVEWFYNEVTARADPIWTYYEAGGFKPSTMEYGDMLSRPASTHPPDLTLPDTSAEK